MAEINARMRSGLGIIPVNPPNQWDKLVTYKIDVISFNQETQIYHLSVTLDNDDLDTDRDSKTDVEMQYGPENKILFFAAGGTGKKLGGVSNMENDGEGHTRFEIDARMRSGY